MRKRRPVVIASLTLVALLIVSGVVFAGLKGFQATVGGDNDKTASVAGGYDNATRPDGASVDGGRGNESTVQATTIPRSVSTITTGPTGSPDPVASGRISNPPEITSREVTNATQNVPYRYDVDATDVDVDPLTYSLDTAPAGMTIHAVSGVIRWTPALVFSFAKGRRMWL